MIFVYKRWSLFGVKYHFGVDSTVWTPHTKKTEQDSDPPQQNPTTQRQDMIRYPIAPTKDLQIIDVFAYPVGYIIGS